MTELVIDPELHSFLPPLDQPTKGLLEDSIKTAGGATQPIEVWKGKNIIVDGHNRYEICQRLKLPFKVIEIEFKDKNEVKRYMLGVQVSRRNLNKEQAAQYRAQYLRMKGAAAVAKGGSKVKATEEAAKELNVSAPTLKRDDAFARGVEKLKTLAPKVATEVNAGKSNINRGTIEALGKAKDAKSEKVALDKTLAEAKREHKKAPITPKAPAAKVVTPAPTPAPAAPVTMPASPVPGTEGQDRENYTSGLTDNQEDILSTVGLYFKATTLAGRRKHIEKLAGLMFKEDGKEYDVPPEYRDAAPPKAKKEDNKEQTPKPSAYDD